MVTSSPSEQRLKCLKTWLTPLATRYQLDLATLRPNSSDASFRQYYRIDSQAQSVLVMDAPPPHEDCRPFVQIDTLLAQQGVHVPRIYEQDLEQGFLLISDLGQHTYYQAIQAGIDDTRLQQLYRQALDALVLMQKTPAQHLPVYDKTRLYEEMGLFEEWYVQHYCQQQLTTQEKEQFEHIKQQLVQANAKEPQVFVHRDFHSPNLMVSDPNPGVIDFQDALLGPLSYDVVSLVMDARTTWEEPQQLDWAIRYWEKARQASLPVPSDFATFHQQYELMGLQRNLRILGVFARLSIRDHKHHYLDHMPRVNQYVRQVAQRYAIFKPLLHLLDRLDNIQPTVGYTF